jgi:hypothetical protein
MPDPKPRVLIFDYTGKEHAAILSGIADQVERDVVTTAEQVRAQIHASLERYACIVVMPLDSPLRGPNRGGPTVFCLMEELKPFAGPIIAVSKVDLFRGEARRFGATHTVVGLHEVRDLLVALLRLTPPSALRR